MQREREREREEREKVFSILIPARERKYKIFF